MSETPFARASITLSSRVGASLVLPGLNSTLMAPPPPSTRMKFSPKAHWEFTCVIKALAFLTSTLASLKMVNTLLTYLLDSSFCQVLLPPFFFSFWVQEALSKDVRHAYVLPRLGDVYMTFGILFRCFVYRLFFWFVVFFPFRFLESTSQFSFHHDESF